MAVKWFVYDDVRGRFVTTTTPGAAVVQDFDVSGSQTNFVVAQVFTSGSAIVVEINGREYREGSTFDWQRNVSLNRIEFNYSVSDKAWVRIKVYP